MEQGNCSASLDLFSRVFLLHPPCPSSRTRCFVLSGHAYLSWCPPVLVAALMWVGLGRNWAGDGCQGRLHTESEEDQVRSAFGW